MPLDSDSEKLLQAYLQEQGHSQEEIATVMHRVNQYEEQTSIDLLMESMADGGSEIAVTIREILNDGGSQMPDKLAE